MKREPNLIPAGLIALACVALILVLAKHQADEYREEIALERSRRDQLEAEIRDLHKRPDDAKPTGE